ncbi:CIC11C00000004176 [Sungouiella intermedia]|uniref:CIC11C00000004176 n=1 Tax=Sungouiella intermedia TaxID=45354 RepID=A0A1L0BGR1_9ASCO|nr:CIC11C00000004176 [[Candida] intermedia]
MYQSYYPIGTAGHRATSLYNYHPHSAYYPIHPGASMAPPPPPPYVPAYSVPQHQLLPLTNQSLVV